MTAERVFQAVFAGAAVLVAASFVGVLLRACRPHCSKAQRSAAGSQPWGRGSRSSSSPGLGLGAAAAGLTLCAVAELGALALCDALERRRGVELGLVEAENRLSRLIEEENDRRAEELSRTLARARADTSSLLAEEERKFALERQRLIAEREEQARTEIAEALSRAQQGAEQRVAALAGDLEQLQQSVRSGDQAARRAPDAADHGAGAAPRGGQPRPRYRARRAARRTGARAHGAGRRRPSLPSRPPGPRSRSTTPSGGARCTRCRSVFAAASASCASRSSARRPRRLQRIKSSFEDIERRQLDKLQRVVDRSGERYVEAAEQQFEASVRTARDEAARRLARELERSSAMFAHEAESVLAERLSKVGDVGAKRVEKRLTESEAVLTRRRDELLAALELRMSDAEAELRRRMAALEAQTEAERGILETASATLRAASTSSCRRPKTASAPHSIHIDIRFSANFSGEGSSDGERTRGYHRSQRMSETETIEVHYETERSKVESWRLHVLIQAGYPLPLAEKLAGSEADLHRAVELVSQGCDHSVAAAILL